ncbi:hypothetical protein LCGC14_1330520 [marine sediment metagenome]|uniref:Uncharacterized protein n=1 Tax=marine sediment metagenome TaxID=412755 RepID=A0A0F9L2R6_9ZZZZ
MKKLILAAVTAVVMFSTSVAAEQQKYYMETVTDPQQRAIVNIVHNEIAECVSFYIVSMVRANANANAKTAKKLNKTILRLYVRARQLHRKDVTEERIKLAQEMIYKQMDNNWKNYFLVWNEYAYHCEEVVKNPRGRIKYWVAIMPQ